MGVEVFVFGNRLQRILAPSAKECCSLHPDARSKKFSVLANKAASEDMPLLGSLSASRQANQQNEQEFFAQSAQE